MEPLKFLEVVLPSSGFLCMTELTTNKKEKAMAGSVAGLTKAYEEFNAKKYDTFCSMASFQTDTSRLGVNALYMRCFFIDIDCNHPKDIVASEKAYPSAKEAVAALQCFLQETGLCALGTPWLNSSGAGVHAYWPLTQDVEVGRWKPEAENLKRLCAQHDLRIDMGVTADIARVMRVPGTINTGVKGGKQVRGETRTKQVLEGDIFDFDELAALFKEKLNGHTYVAPTLQLPGVKPTRPPSGACSVFAKEASTFTTSFKKIAKASVGGDGCKQVLYYFNHASEDGVEPLWRGMLSIAKFCDDSAVAVAKISAAHPYDAERTQKKLSEIKGPYPCSKFDSENPGVCDGCPNLQRLTSNNKPFTPILLGATNKLDDGEKTIIIDEPCAGDPIVLTRPEPPYGYHYAAKGGVIYDEVTKVGNESVTREIPILPYDLYAVSILDGQGVHEVQLTAHRPEGVTLVMVPQRVIGSQDELIKCLASQNIMAGKFAGANGDKYLHGYVRGCVQAISSSRAAVKVPASLGWQSDDSFVLNERVYSPGGKMHHVPMRGMENITRNMQLTGTLDGWKRYVNMFIRKGLYGHLAFGAIGFGAPLMRFLGLDGMTFHACSRSSGTGKTLALDMAASVWGHPQHYRTGAGTSDVTLQQRAGLLHSLPLLSDEITDKQRQTPEWLPGFLLSISQGKGKERMESGANKERLNLSTWSTLCALSSNTYGMDFLSGGRSHSSHGEIFRMLEWNPNAELEFDTEEMAIIQSLRENYGIAGEIYTKWLINNVEVARKVVLECRDHVRKLIGANGGERYWVAGITAVVAGAILAGPKYANIIALPVEKILEFFKGLVHAARVAERSSHRSAEDMLNMFTKEYYGSMVILRDNILSVGEDTLVDNVAPRMKVMGRVEYVKGNDFVDFYIAEAELRIFCSAHTFGYADFKKELKTLYRVDEVRKNLLQGVKGPTMRCPSLKICMPLKEQ